MPSFRTRMDVNLLLVYPFAVSFDEELENMLHLFQRIVHGDTPVPSLNVWSSLAMAVITESSCPA